LFTTSVLRGTALLAACALEACQSPNLVPNGSSGLPAPVTTLRSTFARHLYVANGGTITVYDPETGRLLRTISQGVNLPTALRFDSAGHLFALNASYSSRNGKTYKGTVTEYDPESGALLRTIRNGIDLPADIALDASGNLYVSTYRYVSGALTGSVNVYPRGSRAPARSIVAGILGPDGLRFDAYGNLYVANIAGWVSVYAPGAASATRTVSVGEPLAIELDSLGHLYVSDPADVAVREFAPNSDRIVRNISQGFKFPGALAFDPVGNLYVADWSEKGHISVYRPRTSVPSRTIVRGIQQPMAMVFDTRGYLYVANLNVYGITIYGPRSGRPIRTIRNGINGPRALVFGP
jgi:serine/threonine-protein kinase